MRDYVGSGFDRGHNSPAGDQEDPESMAQSFSLANMMPQAPQNNRIAWASIEKGTRKYVLRVNQVLERVRKGQEPVSSAANVRAELGLDD